MKIRTLVIAIFLFVWGTHFLCKTVTITDSDWVLPLSMSIIREHNTNLDEYKSLLDAKHYSGTENINGHFYYYFPVGTSLLITPVVKALDLICKHIFYTDMNAIISTGDDGGIQLFIASLLVAVTSAFIFLIAFEITKSRMHSLLLVFIFAFCTSAWSTGSRALWSHTCSMLMLSISLFSLLRARGNNRWLLVAAITVACAYIVRPTNSLSVFFLSFYVLLHFRRRASLFFSGLILVLIPFFLYNYHIYNTFLPSYFQPSRIGGNEHLWEGLAGNLISPARGLFIFSPVLFFSIIGIWIKLKDKTFNLLDAALVLIILSHFYIISSIGSLYGGWCFGPRLFTDIIPFLIYFLSFFIVKLPEARSTVLKYTFTSLFILCIGASFFINYKGATHPATFMWNAVPDIDSHPERIWDWNDLQFMR